MNTYYTLDDSPDTQSLSPEPIKSAEFALNHNEESQSILTSLKNIHKKKSDFASNSDLLDEKKMLQSRELFTETETLDHDEGETKDKKKYTVSNLDASNGVECQSISTSAEKRRRTEDYLNKDDTQEDSIESEIKKESHLKNEDILPGAVSCPDCIFDKELDKRNYYFGNLLIGELQFLPPCMRSETYVTILQYVDSLKRKHRNRSNIE